MPVTGYSAIEEKKSQLIRKGLAGSVFVAPYTAAAITDATLFDPATGDLVALPAGYVDLGYLSTDGAKLARSISTTEIKSWGTNAPTRSDIDSDVPTLVVTCQETKLSTIGVYTQQDVSAIVAGDNGSFSIQPPTNPSTRFYRVLAVAVDTDQDGEFVIARFLPRASVTAVSDQTMQNGSNPIEWGVTFTGYEDSTLGYAVDYLIGGAAALALASDMSVPRTVTADLTSASTTLTINGGGKFFASDVGKTVTGTGIPAATTIATFTDSTHVEMSAAATSAETAETVTIS